MYFYFKDKPCPCKLMHRNYFERVGGRLLIRDWFCKRGQVLKRISRSTAKGAANVDDVVEAGDCEQNAHNQEHPAVYIHIIWQQHDNESEDEQTQPK